MAQEGVRIPMVGAIRECGSKSQLDEVFELFSVEDTQAKVDVLIEAMYNPEIFYCSGDMGIDREYKTLVGAFLSGIWKKDDDSEE